MYVVHASVHDEKHPCREVPSGVARTAPRQSRTGRAQQHLRDIRSYASPLGSPEGLRRTGERHL